MRDFDFGHGFRTREVPANGPGGPGASYAAVCEIDLPGNGVALRQPWAHRSCVRMLLPEGSTRYGAPALGDCSSCGAGVSGRAMRLMLSTCR